MSGPCEIHAEHNEPRPSVFTLFVGYPRAPFHFPCWPVRKGDWGDSVPRCLIAMGSPLRSSFGELLPLLIRWSRPQTRCASLTNIQDFVALYFTVYRVGSSELESRSESGLQARLGKLHSHFGNASHYVEDQSLEKLPVNHSYPPSAHDGK
jgi:hypothetical protein